MNSNQKNTLKSGWFNSLTSAQKFRYEFAIRLTNTRARKTGQKWILGAHEARTKHALTGAIYSALDNAANL